jgi:hypothetical protein
MNFYGTVVHETDSQDSILIVDLDHIPADWDLLSVCVPVSHICPRFRSIVHIFSLSSQDQSNGKNRKNKSNFTN